MRSCVTVLGVFFLMCSVAAKDETLDVQAFLPLFERNTLGRKILDVSYSHTYGANYLAKGWRSGKQDVRLVFDAETEKYREEVKVYDNPNDADVYRLHVGMWDGKEYVSWIRFVSKRPGSRALSSGVYESPGNAMITSLPFDPIPFFLSFYYDPASRPFAKMVPLQNPQLDDFSGDTITIKTRWNNFIFSKKTSALERLDCYSPGTDDKMIAWRTYDFSEHVEISGVWLPLRIVITERGLDDRLWSKGEFSVDSKTLRLLDKMDDSSIFNETLPAGCFVDDQVRKKSYQVTTADTLPTDVEALTKTLEKMVEQTLEQKEEAEKEMQEKGKKRE